MATKKDAEKKQADQQPAQQEDNTQQETSSKAIAPDAKAEFDLNQEIDELNQTLNNDLGEIESDNAMELVNQWYDFLHKSKEAGVKELTDGLKELQKLLKSGKATGHEISDLLIHLSEQTSEFAGNADKGLKQPVQRLAKQLRKAGTSIAKAEDQEYHEHLDSLLEQVEADDLTAMEPDAAVAAIDLWYNLLNKAEGEQYKQLATSLKDLRQALKRGNAKPETIAKALSQVGDQTTQVAADIPRGFKGIVQKLGKQLSKSSQTLTAAE